MQVCLPRNPYFFFYPFGFIFDKLKKKVANSCLENTPSSQSWSHERLLIKLVCSVWVSWRSNHCEPKEVKTPVILKVSTHRRPQITPHVLFRIPFLFLPSFQCSLAFGGEFGVCDFTTMERFPEGILCMFIMPCSTCHEVSTGTCYYKISINTYNWGEKYQKDGFWGQPLLLLLCLHIFLQQLLGDARCPSRSPPLHLSLSHPCVPMGRDLTPSSPSPSSLIQTWLLWFILELRQTHHLGPFCVLLPRRLRLVLFRVEIGRTMGHKKLDTTERLSLSLSWVGINAWIIFSLLPYAFPPSPHTFLVGKWWLALWCVSDIRSNKKLEKR